MARGAVIVVGSVNVDHVVVAPRLPVAGETVVGGELALHDGGKGANAAVAAARAGADVRFVGAVGDDELGARALAALAGAGADVAGVARLAGVATGAALIVVDRDGDNQIAVAPGANARVEAGAVRAAIAGARVGPAGGGADQVTAGSPDPHHPLGPPVVLVSCEVPLAAVAAAVEAGHAAGARVVVNPAPVLDGLLDIAGGALLTPNAGEAARLSGEDDPQRAALALSAATGAPVVVTLGADGALVARDGVARRHPAPRVAEVVDTTGAGDAFNGALAAALARGDDLDAAVDGALRVASASVGREGAR